MPTAGALGGAVPPTRIRRTPRSLLCHVTDGNDPATAADVFGEASGPEPAASGPPVDPSRLAVHSGLRPLPVQHGRAPPRPPLPRRPPGRGRRSLRRLGAQRPARLRRRQLQRLERPTPTPWSGAAAPASGSASFPAWGTASTTSSPCRSPARRWEFRGDPFARSLQNDLHRTPIFGETYYEFKHPRVPHARQVRRRRSTSTRSTRCPGASRTAGRSATSS